MTKELFTEAFYLEPYRQELTSQLKLCFELEPGKFAAITEDTCFYPEGGGQPGDRGRIIAGDQVFEVVDTQRRQGEILHLLERQIPHGIAEVKLVIDWQRRFDLMQQHSGEHLISGVCHQLKGYDNVGFHINEETMVIDFNGDLSWPELQEIEDRANQAVWKNLPIEILFPNQDQAKQIEYRAKKEVGANLRLVHVEGYDTCACCGTQLTRTGEIGLVRLRDLQKHRGGVRIKAYCGRRALELDRQQSKILDQLVSLLSEPADKLEAAVRQRLARLNQANQELVELRRQRILEELKQQAGQNQGFFVAEGMASQDLKDLVKELSEEFPDFAILLQAVAQEENKLSFLAARDPASKSDYNLQDLLNLLKSEYPVRGGGQAAFIQGQIEADSQEVLAFLKKHFA